MMRKEAAGFLFITVFLSLYSSVSAQPHDFASSNKMNIALGKAVFERIWVSAPASTQSVDGLGPLYNARACHQCHPDGKRGEPSSVVLRLSIPPQNEKQQQLLHQSRQNVIAEPVYGLQLQDKAVQGHRAEGSIHVKEHKVNVELSDGIAVTLYQPQHQVTALGYGELHRDVMISMRIAPSLLGIAALEAIPENDVLGLADPHDENSDGVSGRPNKVWDAKTNRVALGRYGWKAGVASLREQVENAFASDMGLSTPLNTQPAGDCTAEQVSCRQAIRGLSKEGEVFEVEPLMLDLVLVFLKSLNVPAATTQERAENSLGEQLFYQSGCDRCHHPSFRIFNEENKPYKIWPYSDLLLHDMGEGLADLRPEGQANGREWRTAPLWGMRFHHGEQRYLHDGRARSVLEAVLWHDGEARTSRDAVINMSAQERARLIAFIQSL